MTPFPLQRLFAHHQVSSQPDLSRTIVITGAHGFIGTNLLEELLQITPDFLGLKGSRKVRFSTASLPEASPDAGLLTFLAVDLPEAAQRPIAGRFSHSARVQTLFKNDLLPLLESASHPPLAIIHNGACSSTTETRKEIFDEYNLNSSKDLWTYCCKNHVPFLYASSAAVYGDGTQGFSDALRDSQKYAPLNAYGRSKWEFDQWALEQSAAPPVWYGFRYFNVFGPFESHKGGQASMVFHGYHQILKTGVVKLFKSNTSRYADGEQVRDFVYVKDIVAVTIQCLKRALALREQGRGEGRFLNIGRGEAVSWNRLLTAVFAAMGIPPRLAYIDMPHQLAQQYQNHTCADLQTWQALDLTHRCATIEDAVGENVRKYLLRGL